MDFYGNFWWNDLFREVILNLIWSGVNSKGMRFKKIIEKNPTFNWISIFSYNTKSLLRYSTRFNFHFSIIFWKSQGKQKSTHEPFQEHSFLFHVLKESSQSCHFLFAFVLSETHNYELHVVLDGGGSSQKISFCYFD